MPLTFTPNSASPARSNSDWADSVKSEDTVSVASRDSLSKAKRSEVNEKLGIELSTLESSMNHCTLKQMLPDIQDAPDALLNRVYNALCDTLTTHVFPELDINEKTKSSYVDSLLEAVNLFFIEEQKILASDLQTVEENPVKVFDWKGRIDYSIVRRVKNQRRAYYFVVECKAGSPVIGLKQCVLYLKDIQKLW